MFRLPFHRLKTSPSLVWPLILAACGGGGGGPTTSGIKTVIIDGASEPVPSPPQDSIVGGPTDVAPPDDTQPQPPRNRESQKQVPAPQSQGKILQRQPPSQEPSESNQQSTQVVQQDVPTSAPSGLELLPIVSLPGRVPGAVADWVTAAELRVTDSRGMIVNDLSGWTFSTNRPSMFRVDGTSLQIHGAENLQRYIDDGLPVRVEMRHSSGQSSSWSAEATLDVVNVAQTLALHIYENHPFHKPVAYLGNRAGWQLADGNGDNGLFYLDAEGRVWFIGSAGVPLLDHEAPADAGRNNIYNLRLVRTVDGREEALNLSIQVHDIVNERSWHQRNDYRGLLGAISEQQAHQDVPENLEHMMRGSFWLMPESGPLVLTWSLKTPFSPGQARHGQFPTRDHIESGVFDSRGADKLGTIDKIEAFRQKLNNVFAVLQREINIRFVEVDEAAGTVGHFRIWLFENTNPDLVESEIIGQARFPEGDGVKFIRLLDGRHNDHSFLIPHEVGHLLGLKHPWDHAPHGWEPDGRSERDSKSRTDTIMSYWPHRGERVPGWQELDIALLRLIYGPAADKRPVPESAGLQPFATRTNSASLPENDLIETPPPVGHFYSFSTSRGAISYDVPIDRRGEVSLFFIGVIAPDNRQPDPGWRPQTVGDNAELFEFRGAEQNTVLGTVYKLFLKEAAVLEFGSSWFVEKTVTISLSPQTRPETVTVRFLHDHPLTGDIYIPGWHHAESSFVLRAWTENLADPDHYQIKADQFVFEWRLLGSDDILSNSIEYVPEDAGEYQLTVIYSDPKWLSRTVLTQQVTVHEADDHPRNNYPEVILDLPVDAHDQTLTRTGTDADEWFTIKLNWTVTGGGGRDVFASESYNATVTDFTRGEDKIWLFGQQGLGTSPVVEWQRVDINGDGIVDSVQIGRSYPDSNLMDPWLILRDFNDPLLESDFLLEGSQIILNQIPDVV